MTEGIRDFHQNIKLMASMVHILLSLNMLTFGYRNIIFALPQGFLPRGHLQTVYSGLLNYSKDETRLEAASSTQSELLRSYQFIKLSESDLVANTLQ